MIGCNIGGSSGGVGIGGSGGDGVDGTGAGGVIGRCGGADSVGVETLSKSKSVVIPVRSGSSLRDVSADLLSGIGLFVAEPSVWLAFGKTKVDGSGKERRGR